MRIAVLIAGLATLCCADTLTLRSGRVVTGSYLGGSSRQVRMAVGDRIESFDVSDIDSLKFEGGETSAAQPAPAIAPAPVAAPAPAPAVAAVPAQPVQAPAPAPAAEPVKKLEPRAQRPAVASMPAGTAAEVPANTPVTIRMIDDVDSQNASPGQTFHASVDEDVVVDGRTVIPRGADVMTRLVEIKDPNKITGGGNLTLDLDTITINGRPVQVESGTVTQAGESRKGQSTKVIGGTAALGAIIGAIAGGGKGAAIGAVSGAGAGTAIQVLTKGTRVRVPAETRLTFTLQQPLRINY